MQSIFRSRNRIVRCRDGVDQESEDHGQPLERDVKSQGPRIIERTLIIHTCQVEGHGHTIEDINSAEVRDDCFCLSSALIK